MNRHEQHDEVRDNYNTCRYCDSETLKYISTGYTNSKITKVCRNNKCKKWNNLSFWPEMEYLLNIKYF